MTDDTAVITALSAWGLRHGYPDWECVPSDRSGAQDYRVWRARSRYGFLSIRYTALLVRRGLGAELVAELESHVVGRYARQGHWFVNVLTTGRGVTITCREKLSLDKLVEPEGYRAY